MKYNEYVEFDVRLVGKFDGDVEYAKKYQEYLKNLEDHTYNIQEVEI